MNLRYGYFWFSEFMKRKIQTISNPTAVKRTIAIVDLLENLLKVTIISCAKWLSKHQLAPNS